MADNTERIEILLRARDRDLQRALDRSNRLISRFERDAGNSSNRASRNIERAMQRASAAIVGVASGLAAAAIGQFTSGLGAAVRGVAAIGDEAKRSGLGVEVFQQLTFVATQSRIPVDALIDGMKELNLRADEFVTTGGGSAAEAFGRLGLSAAELTEGLKEPDKLLLEIIGRMEDLDRAAQIRVADEVFGGTGGERFVELISQGEDGIRQLMDRAHEVGAVLDQEMIEKAAEIDRRFGEMTTRIGYFFKNATVNTADVLVNLTRIAEEAASVSEVFDDINQAQGLLGEQGVEALASDPGLIDLNADALARLRQEYVNITQDVEAFARVLEEASARARQYGYQDVANDLFKVSAAFRDASRELRDGTINADEFEAVVSELVTSADAALSSIEAIDRADFQQAISGVGVLSGALATAAQFARNLRANLPGANPGGAVTAPTGRSAAPPNNLREYFSSDAPPGSSSALAPSASRRPRTRPNDIDFGMPPLETGAGAGPADGGGGGGGGSSRPSEWAREVESLTREIKRLEAEAASFLLAAEYGRELGDAAEYARKRAELLVAAQESGREVTAELTQEIDDLARSYVEAAESAEVAEEALDRMRENAERGTEALADMFTGILDGSKSAKEALSDLLIEIAKVQLRQGIARLVGGLPGVGLLGSVLGGARQFGGPVAAGVPYLVNERTPNSEVFVPGRGGAVLSVPQAQAALRGQSRQAGGAVDIRLHVPPGVTVQEVDQRAAGVSVRVVESYMKRSTEARRRS
jgi:molecular chaperone GrpE (heat shock protein)